MSGEGEVFTAVVLIPETRAVPDPVHYPETIGSCTRALYPVAKFAGKKKPLRDRCLSKWQQTHLGPQSVEVYHQDGHPPTLIFSVHVCAHV